MQELKLKKKLYVQSELPLLLSLSRPGLSVATWNSGGPASQGRGDGWILKVEYFLENYTGIGDWQRSYIRDRCSLCIGLRLKRVGTCAETRFSLSAKPTSPFKSAGASVQSTTGSRVVSISGSNAGYTTFRGNAKSTGYPHHSPVSPSLPLPCVTVCYHISTGLK
jgi:hypothetical protein